jgi:D-arabinose 1-dehydrogenase-like Zn-dependent alcohol dehydrogenase
MQAFPLDRFGTPEVLVQRTVPVPTPGPRQVLVEVAACGVCGQDVMRRGGRLDPILGTILGHEVAGTIAATGADVHDFAPGDRVAATQRHACHRCQACLAGEEVLCDEGVMYGEGLDGGYAAYVVIDQAGLAAVPDSVDIAAAAIAACAIGTGLHALRLAGVKRGDRVLVTGATGGVGFHALQLARIEGAETVAVTTRAANRRRLDPVADEVVVLEDGRFDHQIRERDLAPDIVLDLTAALTLNESLRAVRRGGTVVIVGNLENRPVEVLPAAFIIRELRLLGSKACTRRELVEILRLLERGAIEAAVDRTMSLAEAPAAHRLLESGTTEGRIVLRP